VQTERKRLSLPGTNIVCARYAKALFRTARAAGGAESLCGELAAAVDAFGGGKAALFWANPLVSLEKKMAVLDKGLSELGPAVGETCGRFLRVLLANGRLELLTGVAAEYRDLADEAAGRLRAQVRTAGPLSDRQSNALAVALSKRIGREILLNIVEDPELLAGLVVKVGDRVYDGSAKGQLERFSARLSRARGDVRI
jgi:F-type H+-transporting ATPase subunit delta